MSEYSDAHERSTNPSTEDIIRYAAQAALIGRGAEITDQWVIDVVAAFNNNPAVPYPEGVDQGSPITQTEIDAYIDRVPPHAIENDLFNRTNKGTVVLAPFADEYRSYTSFDYGLGILDNSDLLIIEGFARHPLIYRTILDKSTSIVTAEETKRGSGIWTATLRPQQELNQAMRRHLKELPVGAYDGLRSRVILRKFETPQLNEGRIVETIALAV